MEWAKPGFSREDINLAGKKIVQWDFDKPDFTQAVEIVSNFRAAHAYPLNIIQHRLRILASDIDKSVIVAQRLKRFLSIVAKLERFPKMKLWQMQDIGGCRAILSSVSDVVRLTEAIKASNIKHKLWHEDDYILEPSPVGYRSRHLMYRYYSDKVTTSIFNDMRIEVQIRTSMQHSWATTVETVDAFTKQALKSSRGEKEWERFFQLMGTWMAMKEKTPPVPNTPNRQAQLKKELKQCATQLQVEKTLRGFTTALRIAKDPVKTGKSADFYLLSLNNNTERLNIAEFKMKELERALDMYGRVEKRIRNNKLTDAVLVSVNTIQDLKRAYPNYYADTFDFVEELKRALRGKQLKM